jgi:hypothetical protein
LAKQLSDFATFKRNNNSNQQNNQQQQSQSFSSQAQTLSNSSNNYSYSMHKFKLVARATLTAKDISEQIETKYLQVIHESSKINSLYFV